MEYYEQYTLYSFKQEDIRDGDYQEQEQPGILRKIVRQRTGDKITRLVLIPPEFVVYPTYQKSAREMGLFATDNEDGTPALDLWQKFNNEFSADMLEQYNCDCQFAINITLQKIAYMITEHGRYMRDFRLPEPQVLMRELILEQLCFSDSAYYYQLAETLCSKMNIEQLTFYNEVTATILWKPEDRPTPTVLFPIFLDGKAGRGKTFLINAICHLIRAKSCIVLPCGTTALAAQLYEGGHATHSLFRVPVEENNANIEPSIKFHSNRADLICAAKLIIWNELPITNKAVLECVDLLLRCICETDEPFGKKPLIGVRDFCQVAPVVKRARKTGMKGIWVYESLSTWNFSLNLKTHLKQKKQNGFAIILNHYKLHKTSSSTEYIDSIIGKVANGSVVEVRKDEYKRSNIIKNLLRWTVLVENSVLIIAIKIGVRIDKNKGEV
ncbi:PIF1-like helicase-domain-containing protein [Gigaspora rosea]|uniref:ATP-dependent DNA helicase n=1 Tax=Gigaspora rosea TaxID=44941 RepID=A0A397VSR0_9GLOM|nr:PIF1-like helicase-domain-containing protein [Gigaspora rosea]